MIDGGIDLVPANVSLNKNPAFMKLKIYIVLAPLLFVIAGAQAQQSYYYYLSSAPYSSQPPGGPALQVFDSIVTPVVVQVPSTTCPNSPIINTTYFGFNSGFKAKAFFTETYSIEVIFRFKELNGYNRIIDFSNGLLDFGIYSLNSCLNFYPNGNIGPCPAFDTTNFYQLVITRNGASRDMNVYVNGAVFTTFNDASDHYVVGNAPNDSIRFFRDDNVVPNEASNGNVAFIRMADYEFSNADVAASFGVFCNTITSLPEFESGIALYPNPASDWINVSGISKGTLEVYNILGEMVGKWDVSRKKFDVRMLSPGIYSYVISGDAADHRRGSFLKLRQ